MSYVVNIWEQPARLPMPDNAQAIWRMLGALRRRVPGQNPKFLELARQLMVLFPEEQDGAASGRVWPQGALDGRTTSAVWNLGLHSGERLDEVKAVLAARATALGLNVSDEQAGDLYLAGGNIISRRPGAHCMPAFAAYFAGDHAAAWQAFLELAGRGNLVAVHNLGLMLLRGETGRKNFGLAHALLVVAGEHEEATRLGARLRPESLAAAGALVQKLKQPGRLVERVQRILAASPMAPALKPAPAPSAVPAPVSPLARAAAPVSTTAPVVSEPDDAIKALMRRASQGDKHAQLELAAACKTGLGLEQNNATAVYWWSLAAAQGLAEAQYRLALACFFGEGTARDQSRAFKLHCQAADQAHPEAIYHLGVMHMQGIATPRDVIAGKALYVYAKSMGSEQAVMPSFELGEASRALMLATLMGQSGKVLNTLVDWQRNKAEAAASERDLESENVGLSMAEAKAAARKRALAAARANAASERRFRWHIGHFALLLGSLGMVPALALYTEGEPAVLVSLMALLMLCGVYGVWRGARDFGLPRRIRGLLVLLALLPFSGMLVCMAMLLQLARRRLA